MTRAIAMVLDGNGVRGHPRRLLLGACQGRRCVRCWPDWTLRVHVHDTTSLVRTVSREPTTEKDREAALGLLTELQRLQRKDGRVRHLVRQVAGLIEEAEEARDS